MRLKEEEVSKILNNFGFIAGETDIWECMAIIVKKLNEIEAKLNYIDKQKNLIKLKQDYIDRQNKGQ